MYCVGLTWYIQIDIPDYFPRHHQATPTRSRPHGRSRAPQSYRESSAGTLTPPPSIELSVSPPPLVAPNIPMDFKVLQPFHPNFGQAANPRLTESQRCYFQEVKEWLHEMCKDCIVCSFVGLRDEGKPVTSNPWCTSLDLGCCEVHLNYSDYSDCTFNNYLSWKPERDEYPLAAGTACYFCLAPWYVCNPRNRVTQCETKDTVLPLM